MKDTSRSQFELVKQLVTGGKVRGKSSFLALHRVVRMTSTTQITAVGDDDQVS